MMIKKGNFLVFYILRVLRENVSSALLSFQKVAYSKRLKKNLKHIITMYRKFYHEVLNAVRSTRKTWSFEVQGWYSFVTGAGMPGDIRLRVVI